MEVLVERRTLRFREPLRTAFGTLETRDLLELTLDYGDDRPGRGEAAPLEPYDGVPLGVVEQALDAYRPVLQRADELGGPQVLDACRAIADLPQALSAVDLALWDRAGKREGRPVAALLARDPVWAVPVNATIGAEDRAGAAAAAGAAARDGFGCLKVKVGIGDDAGRVAAVRAAAGPDVALRLDANGAWTVEQAIAAIESLAPAGLELVEEPVHGLQALAQVRRAVAVRIAMDETAEEPGALASGAADAVCLKLSRCGGIAGLLAAAELVRATGSEPYIASTFDGSLGIAAAVHAAAALSPLPPCGLATLALFEGEPALTVADGAVAVPEGPGLGI
jgi:L-alanine-DL-glutamate epimerase-like enolase superfamily enzyme